jgi:OmpA-OmpF porin, OOP family
MKKRFLGTSLIVLLLSVWCIGQGFEIETLEGGLNTKSDEMSPILLPDGRSMFFTRMGYEIFDHSLMYQGQDLFTSVSYDEYLSTLRQAYLDIGGPWDGPIHEAPANQDIWYYDLSKPALPAEHLKHPLNNALPNSVLSRTPDPNVYYVVNKLNQAGTIEKGISYIERIRDSWSYPSAVEIDDFYTITSEVSLSISYDGKFMIMSANRSDARELDLYLLKQQGEHKWSAPVHLGSSINSSARETAPSLSDDGLTLYFTSNRDGNNDIFFSTRLDDTWQNWSAPKKMDAPINCDYDDGQPCFNSATGYLYFTSKRYGSSDIFRAKIAPPQAQFITVTGRVINERTGQMMKRVAVEYATDGVKPITIFSEDGMYKIQVPRGKKYQIRATKAAFGDGTGEVFFKNESRVFHAEYVLDLGMQPYGVNEQIEMKSIYYTQSKATILEQSIPEVQRLAGILKDNINLQIRIEGHTDNMGKTSDLIMLSEERAEALKSALVKSGVSASRITTKGFGGAQPVGTNDTDEQRKKNRRVEIIITNI